MKILFVTKDMMPFRALHPLASALAKAGDNRISVVAEGLSLNKWVEARYKPVYEDPMFNRDNCEKIFDTVKPDVLVVGLSSPINAEDICAAEANHRKIPVVAFSDTWGTTSRFKVGKPNLVLTMDESDRRLARERFPQAKVLVVGDWINKPVENPISSWAVGKHSLFIAGQNPATLREFVDTALGLMENKSNWQVVFTAHPKYKGAPEMEAAIGCLRQSGVILVEPGEASGDDLASTADVTVSSFSGALRVTVLSSKVAVSVETSPCIIQMEKSTGLRRYPLVTAGCCKGTTEHFTLEELLRTQTHLVACERYRKSIWPHRLDEAVSAILAFGIKH